MMLHRHGHKVLNYRKKDNELQHKIFKCHILLNQQLGAKTGSTHELFRYFRLRAKWWMKGNRSTRTCMGFCSSFALAAVSWAEIVENLWASSFTWKILNILESRDLLNCVWGGGETSQTWLKIQYIVCFSLQARTQVLWSVIMIVSHVLHIWLFPLTYVCGFVLTVERGGDCWLAVLSVYWMTGWTATSQPPAGSQQRASCLLGS